MSEGLYRCSGFIQVEMEDQIDPLFWALAEVEGTRAHAITQRDVDIEEYIENRAGGFIQAVADGDIEESWYRADGNHTRALSYLLAPEFIDAHFDREAHPRDFKADEFLHKSWI